MDKHWQRLINPKGGAPGYSKPTRGVETVRPAAPGITALYRDANGAEFTLEDCHAKLPHLTREAVKDRLKRSNTFEEITS